MKYLSYFISEETPLGHIPPRGAFLFIFFNQKSQPKTPFRGRTLQIKGTHT
tara:strand:- start:16 stop:168 length:153 start_codon:yes stop_codon:yes gene_type:complete